MNKSITHRTIITIILLFFLNFCPLLALDSKYLRLNDVVNRVVTAYNKKNTDSISTYIHPQLGLYYLIKTNNVEYWLHRQKICLGLDCVEKANLPAPYGQLLLEQQVEESNESFKVDTKYQHKLTHTIRKFASTTNEFTNKELRDIWRMESNSRRVVVSSKGNLWGANIVFYFSYFDNNWYLSIIDFNDN